MNLIDWAVTYFLLIAAWLKTTGGFSVSWSTDKTFEQKVPQQPRETQEGEPGIKVMVNRELTVLMEGDQIVMGAICSEPMKPFMYLINETEEVQIKLWRT